MHKGKNYRYNFCLQTHFSSFLLLVYPPHLPQSHHPIILTRYSTLLIRQTSFMYGDFFYEHILCMGVSPCPALPCPALPWQQKLKLIYEILMEKGVLQFHLWLWVKLCCVLTVSHTQNSHTLKICRYIRGVYHT